jgi:hypothetical protein
VKVHSGNPRAIGVDQPRIDIDESREVARRTVIGGAVIRLPADSPAGMQRREEILFGRQILQYLRQSRGQIVVQQHQTWSEIG